MIEGIDQAIFTTAVALDDLNSDSAIHACPIILQNRIRTQFDLRVTVVGTEVFAARIFVRDRTEGDMD